MNLIDRLQRTNSILMLIYLRCPVHPRDGGNELRSYQYEKLFYTERITTFDEESLTNGDYITLSALFRIEIALLHQILACTHQF